MRSATLPPDLAAVAREARRNGRASRRRGRRRSSASATTCRPTVVPNGAIAERIGVDDAWIVTRTGIRSRRRARRDERLADLATFAAAQARSPTPASSRTTSTSSSSPR